MTEEASDGIGTPETRKMVDKLARGNPVAAESVIKTVEANIGTCSNTELVDLKHCLSEWKIKSGYLYPHLKDWEKTAKILAPTWWAIDGLVGSLLGMTVYTVLQAKEQKRQERLNAIIELVDGQIGKRSVEEQLQKST